MSAIRTPVFQNIVLPALALLAIVLAMFWKVAFTAEYSFLTGPDNCHQSYPWIQFTASELRAGRLPQWNPYSYGGTDFIGELQPGVFGPFQLLACIAPAGPRGRVSTDVLEGTVLLAYWIAGLLMFGLCRSIGLAPFPSLVGAICFLFSGFMATRPTQQVNIFLSAVWVPGILLFAFKSQRLKRWGESLFYASVAGAFLALSVLSGHHHPGGLALLAAALGAIPGTEPFTWGRMVRRFLLVGWIAAMGFAFSAVQTLPTLQYARHAVRWVSASEVVLPGDAVKYETLQTQYTVHPSSLAGFLSPALDQTVDGAVYFGIPALLLALLGLSLIRENRWVRMFGILAGGALIYSLGQFSLLHGLANVAVPGLDKLREAVRALLVVHLAFAVLAAFGTARLAELGQAALRKGTKLCGYASMAGVALLVGLISFRIFAFGKTAVRDLDPLAFSVILLGLVCGALQFARGRRAVLNSFLIGLLLLDYGYFVSRSLHPKAQIADYPPRHYAEDGKLEFLKSRPGLFRIHDPDQLIPPNAGLIYRLQFAWGYGASASEPYWRFFTNNPNPGGLALDLLGVRYLVSRKEVAGWKVVWRDSAGETAIYENPAALPRARIAHQARTASDMRQALDLIEGAEFSPESEVVLIGPSEPSRNRKGSSEVEITHWEPGRLKITTRSETPGYLVLGEVNYPGWKAVVDGHEVDPLFADGPFMAFPLKAGNRSWEIRFTPAALRWGVWLSGFTCTGFLIQAVLCRRRRAGKSGLMDEPGASL